MNFIICSLMTYQMCLCPRTCERLWPSRQEEPLAPVKSPSGSPARDYSVQSRRGAAVVSAQGGRCMEAATPQNQRDCWKIERWTASRKLLISFDSLWLDLQQKSPGSGEQSYRRIALRSWSAPGNIANGPMDQWMPIGPWKILFLQIDPQISITQKYGRGY